MTRLFTVLAVVALVVVASFSLVACNTIEGIGKDAQAAGSAITGSAQSSRSY